MPRRVIQSFLVVKRFSHYLISDLEVTVVDQETRLTAAEENIQGRFIFRYNIISSQYLPLATYAQDILIKNPFFTGLQITDVELDARNTVLEENGGWNGVNGILFKLFWP